MEIVELGNRGINGHTSEALPREETGQIRVPLGKDGDQIVWVDFADVPGVLISGTTGSGKTAFVQAIVLEIMQRYTPNECRFLFFDSKQIDYKSFCNSQFSLLPVCSDYQVISDALEWVAKEIQRRYNRISDVDSMPHIFVILDDCSDILGSDNLERLIAIMRRARAVRIHCWFVSSMPTTSVINNELKANITGRISFFVTSKQLSRLVLDVEGAETLRSPGEMIYRFVSNRGKCDSIYYSENDIKGLLAQINVRWSRDEATSPYQEILRMHKTLSSSMKNFDFLTDNDGRDEFFAQAGRFIIEHNKASIGMIQRVYKIGFNRAARIMDQLAEAGVVGPEEGTKPREILMTAQEFERFLIVQQRLDGNTGDYKRCTSTQVQSQKQKPSSELIKPVVPQAIVAKPQEEDKRQVSISQQTANVVQVNTVKLSNQPYIAGIGCDVGVASNCVVVRWTEGPNNYSVVAGALIWRIVFKKPSLLGKGSLSISSKDGRVITVTFSRKTGEEFETFVERLAFETGVVFELA